MSTVGSTFTFVVDDAKVDVSAIVERRRLRYVRVSFVA